MNTKAQATSQWSSLSACIKSTEQLATQLIHALEREKTALIEQDTRLLEGASAEKHCLLEALEKSHLAILAASGTEQCNLDPLLCQLEAQQDICGWDTLKETLSNGQRQNTVNGLLLNRTIARVKTELTMLTGRESVGYAPQGESFVQPTGVIGRA